VVGTLETKRATVVARSDEQSIEDGATVLATGTLSHFGIATHVDVRDKMP
jgi:hypothetical protein